MKKILNRWIDALPSKLRPRGIRYHPASFHQSARLVGKRIFILPTRQGLVFLLLLLIMLLGATNYGNNMAFALTFMLGSILFVSILYTYQNLVGLQIQLLHIDNAFVGGEVEYVIDIYNDIQRPRYDIELRCNINSAATENVAGDSHNRVSLRLPALRRGLLSIGKITLTTRYPFGLFYAWCYVNIVGDALIYPHPGVKKVTPSTATASGDGIATEEPGCDDFHGLRIYSSGDAMRHIDWKAYARERGLLTKQFQRHQSPELWFEWNATTGNNIEDRLSQLCRWVVDAEQRRQRYGLRLPNVEIAPNIGATHQQFCLQQLALFGIAR